MKKTKTYQRSFISQSLHTIRKVAFASLGTAGILAFAGQMFFASGVQAYTQMSSRAILMNTNLAGATAQYTLTFTPYGATSIGTIIVDFCQEDPIPGDTCTGPSSMSLSVGSVTAPSGTGISGWTGKTLIGTHAIGFYNPSTAQSPSGVITTVWGGNTNPNVTGTFYARILTYAAVSTGETGVYTSTAIGTPIDAGGAALAITVGITITAKVQEQLTFCVWTGATCGTGNTVNIGAASNGDWILSSGNIYGDANTQFSITTNALHAVNVQAFGNVLTSGTNYIEASGTSGMGAAAQGYAATAGTPQYGFCIGTPWAKQTQRYPCLRRQYLYDQRLHDDAQFLRHRQYCHQWHIRYS